MTKVFHNTIMEGIPARVPRPSSPDLLSSGKIASVIDSSAVKVSKVVNIGSSQSSLSSRAHPTRESMFPEAQRSRENAMLDFTNKSDVYRTTVEKLPGIISIIEAHLKPKLPRNIVRSWKAGDVKQKRENITKELISLIGRCVENSAPGSSEDLDITLFRMLFSNKDALLSDLLRHKLDEMVMKLIVEIRGARIPTIPDLRLPVENIAEKSNLKEMIMELDESDIIGISDPKIEERPSNPSPVEEFRHSTMIPPAMSKTQELNDLQLFSSDTSNIDDEWDDIPPSQTYSSSVNEPVEFHDTLNEVDLKQTDQVPANDTFEMLTAEDIIEVMPNKHDSLAPVVSLKNEPNDMDFDDDNTEDDDILLTLKGPGAQLIAKYRFLVSAAALAIFAGGGTVYLHKTQLKGGDAIIAAVQSDDNPKNQKTAKSSLNEAKVEVNEQKINVVKEFVPVVSDSAYQKISQIADQNKRSIFEKMLYEGKFNFSGNKRNTVDQLLLPFYSIATPQQKQQLDQVAKNFNIGLYASATKRFGGLNPDEKNRLLHNNNPNNSDGHVYRALKNSKYGDPANWNSEYRGQPYKQVFHNEMDFYERFEREMTEIAGSPQVFSHEGNDDINVFDSGTGKYNAVIEAASKIVFGSDFSQARSTDSIPDGPDAEIPVIWDLE